MSAHAFLRDKLTSGHDLRGLSCSLGDPQIVEEFARAGFDFVYLDQQHGHFTADRLTTALRAFGGTGTSPMVRVADNNPALIGAALDGGAEGVIVPDVETPEAAVRAARACRYAPAGSRSWGPMRAVHGIGTDPATVNERVVCLVMVESRAGVEALDAILDVPGIDGVYIGPADLSVSLGGKPLNHAEQHDPAVLQVIDSIRATCTAHGKVAAISGRPAQLHAVGYRMVTAGQDYGLLRSALARLRTD